MRTDDAQRQNVVGLWHGAPFTSQFDALAALPCIAEEKKAKKIQQKLKIKLDTSSSTQNFFTQLQHRTPSCTVDSELSPLSDLSSAADDEFFSKTSNTSEEMHVVTGDLANLACSDTQNVQLMPTSTVHPVLFGLYPY